MASAILDTVKSAFQPHHENGKAEQCCSHAAGPGYASPLEAQKGPREKLLYITAIYTGNLHFLLIQLRPQAAVQSEMCCTF